MANSARPQGRSLSVRVQIFPHEITTDATVGYLKAFRLRVKDDSSFAELARIALARYAKDDKENGSRARVASILDEKDCALDLEDGVDLVAEGEMLKLVLAPHRHVAASSTPPDMAGPIMVAGSRSSQTPAVKNIPPRTPAVFQALASKSTRSTRSLARDNRVSGWFPLKPLQATPGRSDLVPTLSSQGKGSGRKRDPYEIPSDSESAVSHTNNNLASKGETKPYPTRIQPQVVKRTATNAISSDAKVISIKHSSSCSRDSIDSSGAENLEVKSTPQQEKARSPQAPLRDGSTAQAKRSASHTVNGHLSIVRDNQDNSIVTEDIRPIYEAKTSRGTVPVFLKQEALYETRNIIEKPLTSSVSSSKSMKSANSSKSSRSVGSLTLTPSRVPQATKEYGEMLVRKREQREAEHRQAAKQKVEQEESRKKAKARAKENLPAAAIAHVKSITKTKFGRKGSTRPIPDSFFAEPECSDEDLGEIITGGHPLAVGGLHSYQASLNTLSSQCSTSNTKAISPTTYFKPINTLWPRIEPKTEVRTSKKLGAGYSQRARDAFSDLDDDDNGGSTDSHSDHEDRCDTGTPEPFRRWMNKYETYFTPHVGFCSVANGPFKGLVRNGPQKGTYLPGHAPPTQEGIAGMEKTATLRDQSSDSDFSEVESNSGSDIETDHEQFLIAIPQSAKTTSSPTTVSDTTSVLIMKQLTNYAPPSNQELGILMSSSPSRGTGCLTRMSGCSFSPRLASAEDTGVDSVKSQYSSNDICLETDLRQTVIEETPKRSRYHYDADLDVTPSFERALSQVETPSTKSRSTHRSLRLDGITSEDIRTSPSGQIVVKIPEISIKKQAEYAKVPESSVHGLLTAPLRSFEEINDENEDISGTSQDSGAAAIEQVLKASPSWLANITEVKSQPSTTANKPYALRSRANGTPGSTIFPSTGMHSFDEAKDQDPTYQPSEIDGPSYDSGHCRRKIPRKTAKNNPNATRGRAHQISGPSSRNSVARSPSKRLSPPAKKHGVPVVASRLVSSTPIPLPATPNLLQKTESRPVDEQRTSGVQLSTSPEHTPYSNRPEVKVEMPVPSSISTQPHLAIGSAAKTNEGWRRIDHGSSKRKHDDEHIDTQDQAIRHGRKRQKQEQSLQTRAQHKIRFAESSKHHHKDKQDLSRDDRDTTNGSRNSKDGSDATSYPALPSLDVNADTPRPLSEPLKGSTSFDRIVPATTNEVETDQSPRLDRKRRRKGNRKLGRNVEGNEVGSPVSGLARRSSVVPLSAQAITIRHMSKEDKKAFKSQTRGVKASGYGHCPTLPPIVASNPAAHESSVTKEALRPAVPIGRKQGKSSRTYASQSATKLLSPPVTSRPSSAGSCF